ncbi:MAG: pyrimidine dimer DNA glycosylase [Chloroflexi bacterium]|nr:pyrimidine dimer DNA glycosylase [Chloroflexota bacterium]
MRIWDIAPERLCRKHLLAEHRELHGVWTILTQGKKGYAHHPEVLRWKGKLRALYLRHEKLVAEMASRAYSHASPLAADLAAGEANQNEFIDSHDRQIEILRNKGRGCDVR